MQVTRIAEEPLVHEVTSTEVDGFLFGSGPANAKPGVWTLTFPDHYLGSSHPR